MEQAKSFDELNAQELNELGNAYSARGMWEDAIRSYLRSLALRKTGGDIKGQGIVLNNLGAVYYSQGRREEALECYEGSWEIANKCGQKLSELVALMNLVFLHFTEGQDSEFLVRAEQAEELALALERWEPLSKLSWLRGRLALSGSGDFEQGAGHYADALRLAATEGETELMQMLSRVDRQAEELLFRGSRGMALVLYDYLLTFVEDQGFSEKIQDYLADKRDEILHRPSLP